MIHLTLTGIMAGKPICGSEKLDDDTFVHAIYYERIPNKDEVCQSCKDELTAAEQGE